MDRGKGQKVVWATKAPKACKSRNTTNFKLPFGTNEEYSYWSLTLKGVEKIAAKTRENSRVWVLCRKRAPS